MTEVTPQAILEAWNTTRPYSQMKDFTGPTKGQYDFVVSRLEPTSDRNGLYCIVGEFAIQAPAGFQFPFKRTLYVGTHKDKLADLPETCLQSPGLNFLRKIAKVNHIPTNDQPDAQLCQALIGRAFGCRLEEGKPYTAKDGTTRVGLEFGRNVTPAGTIPARLDEVAATPASNGHDTGTTPNFVTE